MQFSVSYVLIVLSQSRHSDSKIASKDGKSSAEEDMSDVYPLQLRLVVLREADSFGVKISKKVSI